jgi:hypothetical protein
VRSSCRIVNDLTTRPVVQNNMRNPFTSSKKSESEEETLDANLHQLAREDAAPGETTPDLSLVRTLLLSASVTLASLSLGFAYHTVTVTLNLLAEDLKINEGDLQWASNAYLLGLVSVFDSFLKSFGS